MINVLFTDVVAAFVTRWYMFDAYSWKDLAAELGGKPGATTRQPDKSVAQAEAEEELLWRPYPMSGSGKPC